MLTDFQRTKLYPFQPWVYSGILKILQISASIFLQNDILTENKRVHTSARRCTVNSFI